MESMMTTSHLPAARVVAHESALRVLLAHRHIRALRAETRFFPGVVLSHPSPCNVPPGD